MSLHMCGAGLGTKQYSRRSTYFLPIVVYYDYEHTIVRMIMIKVHLY